MGHLARLQLHPQDATGDILRMASGPPPLTVSHCVTSDMTTVTCAETDMFNFFNFNFNFNVQRSTFASTHQPSRFQVLATTLFLLSEHLYSLLSTSVCTLLSSPLSTYVTYMMMCQCQLEYLCFFLPPTPLLSTVVLVVSYCILLHCVLLHYTVFYYTVKQYTIL